MKSAKGLGFGKAAPGASFSAMYLDGTINGVVGIYRSIDTGASWVRIDGLPGQYGKSGYDKSIITGDPKVFGTVHPANGMRVRWSTAKRSRLEGRKRPAWRGQGRIWWSHLKTLAGACAPIAPPMRSVSKPVPARLASMCWRWHTATR